ncbi:MAG TPA: hypothetical protein VI653_30440 [Steroidobacteraceae bacterium]
MTAQERALHALRSLVRFEVAMAGAEAATAMLFSARAHREMAAAMQRCESSEQALRAVMLRPEINPALLATSRHLFRAQRTRLQGCRTQHEIARSQEERAREELANQRNRERSLERALEGERRKRHLKQQQLEFSIADDLWSQQAWAQQRTFGRWP